LGTGEEEGLLRFEAVEQLKAESNFFTFVDEHLGHSASFSGGYRLCNREKVSLQFKHIYS
jgi:hypothetical protein